MNTKILLLLFFSQISLIEPIFSTNASWPNDRNQNKTLIEPNGSRFQRILRRKRRFLLFPPGAAIVTTMSFTKTLVPRYPTGINMIAECDIFYPLQNQIADWYPTKKPAPPPPPPPPEEEYEDMAQGVLPGNFGTMQPQNEQQPAPIDSQVNARPPPPMDIPLNDVPENDAPVNNGGVPPQLLQGEQNQFLPTPANGPTRLPTDQEIGITPGTIISDPNFNVGAHPGEIYVDDKVKGARKTPPRRYYSQYSKYYPASRPQQQYYPYQSPSNSTGNVKTYNDVRNYNAQHFSRYNNKSSWNRFDKNIYTMQSKSRIYSDAEENAWRYPYRNHVPSESSSSSDSNAYGGNVNSRGARERRDIFDQLESFMSFKQFDAKSCILRMICEAKHYLLPPGKSLFQDIFRVLFTLPMENDPIDEYSRASQSTEEDCDSVYVEKCRFSVLGLLMSKDRPIL